MPEEKLKKKRDLNNHSREEKDKAQNRAFYQRIKEINPDILKKEKLKRIEQIKAFDYEQTDEERELYEKFKEIAKNDPDEKFKIEHIEELNTNAQIIIVFGKKGIGKTYQISKIITELAEKDPSAQIILMRNTISEFQALHNQLQVSYSPIFMKSRTTNNPVLFHKHLYDGRGLRYMGFCVALSGFSLVSAKGAEYDHIRLIIWDECTNLGKSSGGYSYKEIKDFVTFLDSIIRSKTELKIYIFGNFHRNTDGAVSSVLLDTFKVPYDCTLKLKTIDSMNLKNTIKFLYINTGDLYTGIDSNAFIGAFSNTELMEDLATNMPRSSSYMTAGLNRFYGHKPEWAYLFNGGKETYLLLLSSFKDQKSESLLEVNWMIHIETFPTFNDFVHPIYTADIALYNEFNKQNIELISAEEEKDLIVDLYEMCINRSLFFSSDNTRFIFRAQMLKWETKHKLGSMNFFAGWKEWKTLW